MHTYIFSYRSPIDYNPTEETRMAWRDWLNEVDPHLREIGSPVFSRRTVGASDTGVATVLGGYSLLDAENLAQACELAEGCPLIALGGAVEVGDLAHLNQVLESVPGAREA